jgi:integrase
MPLKKIGLTDAACRNAKPRIDKNLKLYDSNGLLLLVRPNGSKLWRLKFRLGGVEKQLALGAYPDVTLAGARALASDQKRQIDQGVDPLAKRKQEKARQERVAGGTFRVLAEQWQDKNQKNWVKSHADKVKLRLDKNVLPWLGEKQIHEIEPSELLSVLRRIESRGATDTAHRVLQHVSMIYRFAIASGIAKYNPAPDIREALEKPVRGHFATITDEKKLATVLRAIDAYEGSFITRTALALAPMLFCRPGELRGMRWSEVDLDKAEIRIPPRRRKLKKAAKESIHTPDFIIPLSRQAAQLLIDIKPQTGGGEFVFPSERGKGRSMSDGTVNAALRRLGFDKTEITGHGFRHTASTMLNEKGFSQDAIEAQLSHSDSNVVRGIYNKAKYLPERQRMMQAWADFLDDLRSPFAQNL